MPRENITYNYTPKCPVCGAAVEVRKAMGRRSHKPSVMLICPEDGRHLRAFITYQPYVKQVLDRPEVRQ